MIEGRMASCQLAFAGPLSNESEYTRRKIYVSNVAAEIDPNKLTEFFSTFGEIEEGPLGFDKQTGKARGFWCHPGLQGGYVVQPQMGRGGVRPPYMGGPGH
ncbi:ubp1-associated protein 2b [Phtheirospermum japonicum]|uniref:Ubp1-associated protein 2b n=1 Tax=Phtheirospermum japonicum TaxID=374723 RepID=A0A830DJT1_9LAMI|nr:ubp1-associated protein 2b [Phtheirospermum japonicum]